MRWKIPIRWQSSRQSPADLFLSPGGNIVRNGVEGIKALSWKQVQQIAKKFEALNPYNRQIISGSVLKIEDDNFDPKTIAAMPSASIGRSTIPSAQEKGSVYTRREVCLCLPAEDV